MSEPSLITVNCVHCDNQNAVDFNAFQRLKFVKCDNCGNKFNVFGVYKYLYDNFLLCKKMVDVSVDFGRARYAIETENAQEGTKISSFLEIYQFQEMIDRILHDMATYGDCFVQTISDKTIILQRLEPTDLEFKIDWINEPPARSYHEAITRVQKLTSPFTKYDVKTLLHFENGVPISGFRGESIFGFWFKDWYFLRNCAEMAPLLGVEGERYSDVRWFRDFKESSVLGAAGIPHELIFPWMRIDNPTFRKIETDRFVHDIERRRSKISRIMERNYFQEF